MYFRSHVVDPGGKHSSDVAEKAMVAAHNGVSHPPTDRDNVSFLDHSATTVRDDYLLPTPILASTNSSKAKIKKSARIENGFRVRWAQIKKLIGNTSEPASESALDLDTTEGSSWDKNHAEPRPDDSEKVTGILDPALVDEIILDRTWYASEHEKTSSAHSETGGTQEKVGSHPVGTSTDRESVIVHSDRCWGLFDLYAFVRWRIVPWTLHFFSPRNFEAKTELQYRKEVWYTSKVRSLL